MEAHSVRTLLLAVLLATGLGCGEDESTPTSPPPPPAVEPPTCADHERAAGESCVPVGVIECAGGFESDGRGGCDPVLPEAMCADGLLALPGETTCREIAPCPAGKYGDIPTNPITEYVDGSYTGMDSDGSLSKPWTTIQAGVDAADPNATVAVAAGSYRESVVIDGKTIRLFGKCPAEVEVVGVAGESAILMQHATGAEVHTLAVRGGNIGIDIWGVVGAVDRVWVHDTDVHALAIEADFNAETNVQVVGSLFERGKRESVRVFGGRATFTHCAVRSSEPYQGEYGIGMFVIYHDIVREPGHVDLRSCLLENNRDVGLFVLGASAHVEATVIRDTTPDEQGVFGRGIDVEAGGTANQPASLTLLESVVANNHDVGVFSAGASVVIDSTVVRDTAPGIDGRLGRGVHIRDRPELATRGSAAISNSLVERVFDVGLYVSGSDASLLSSIIRGTQPRAADGLFGDGISVFGMIDDGDPALPARLDIDGSLIAESARGGMSCFGASVTMADNTLRCNALQLDGELSAGLDAEFEDRGNNVCFCGDQLEECRVVSTTLEPPDAID